MKQHTPNKRFCFFIYLIIMMVLRNSTGNNSDAWRVIFGPKVGQNGPKWDKSGTFPD